MNDVNKYFFLQILDDCFNCFKNTKLEHRVDYSVKRHYFLNNWLQWAEKLILKALKICEPDTINELDSIDLTNLKRILNENEDLINASKFFLLIFRVFL